MPRRFSSWRALAAVACVALAPATVAAQLPTSLTFFGDSFTDTGNGDILAALLAGTDLTPSPPYAPGRASNGLVYADYLAAAFGRPGDASPSLLGGRNFAIGTARTGTTGALGLPLGMLSQLAQYPPAITDPAGLYVIFGGSLDVFDAATLGTAAQQTAAINQAVDNLGLIATQLYGYGARSFLMPNLANVGLSPRGLGSGASSLLGALTAQFNTTLGTKLSFLGSALPGSTFFGLRLDTLFDNILIDAAQGGPRYGLTNTTIPCFLPGAPSCATSIFVDDLHPTTQVHGIIAQAAYQRVVNGTDVSAVPEPATILLVASGLCVVGVVARRRTARRA